jgi:hypothetical protein
VVDHCPRADQSNIEQHDTGLLQNLGLALHTSDVAPSSQRSLRPRRYRVCTDAYIGDLRLRMAWHTGCAKSGLHLWHT